jgi:hypothetical protein
MTIVSIALLDMPPPVPSASGAVSLIVAGVLLSLAIFFLGRLFWKRGGR